MAVRCSSVVERRGDCRLRDTASVWTRGSLTILAPVDLERTDRDGDLSSQRSVAECAAPVCVQLTVCPTTRRCVIENSGSLAISHSSRW